MVPLGYLLVLVLLLSCWTAVVASTEVGVMACTSGRFAGLMR